MSVHDGHRKRVKKKFLDQGLEGMYPHEVLEFLLFFAVPRGDTNPIAHNLIKNYKNIAGVLDAPIEDLMNIDGIGENTAIFLKLLPEFFREYSIAKCEVNIIKNSKSAGEYYLPKFVGRTVESFFITLLDNKAHIIKDVLISVGTVNQVSVNVRKIVEIALKNNAALVILAHNHPNGVATPSLIDLTTTDKIKNALGLVNITLFDHIIVANEEYISLADIGKL